MVRMIKEVRPKVGDIVMCRVEEVHDLGSYVRLLEYDNIQGMIAISELSRLRIRSIAKIINVGKVVAAEVIAVDDKYIDLSKRNVTSEQTRDAQTRYKRYQRVQTIIRKTAHRLLSSSSSEGDVETELDAKMLQLYEQYIWPRVADCDHSETLTRKWGDTSMGDTSVSEASGNVDEEFRVLREVCEQVYAAENKQPYIAKVAVLCVHPDGIDMIKRVFHLARQNSPNVRVEYTGKSEGMATEYRCSVTTVVYLGELELCLSRLIEESKQIEGMQCTITKPPALLHPHAENSDDDYDDTSSSS